MYDPDTPINFRCLAEECPNSCCGPFAGVEKLKAALRKSDLSEALGESEDYFFENEEQTIFTLIRLRQADVEKLLGHGFGDMIVRRKVGEQLLYFLRLKRDGSCHALDEKGRCTIYAARPAVCRAFPFYVDMFGGLSMIESCPGVGAGRSTLKDHSDEISAVRELYEMWLSAINMKQRVR
ncbi:MAG: YkgJ family cysteine cluster protein [Alphaproteobacteria bacterium]|nr:YkgJ family cysteine cluster protein [Alphaproteobacteria bacterium]